MLVSLQLQLHPHRVELQSNPMNSVAQIACGMVPESSVPEMLKVVGPQFPGFMLETVRFR